MKAILSKIQAQMEENLYLGASISFYNDGEWQSYYLGTQDGDCPVKPGLVYDLASVSKVVGVATLFIQLLHENVIQLDDTVVQHYPEVKDRTLTIRQLLTHTSGINPYIPNRDHLDFRGLKQAINQIAVTEDKSFYYTDINFILLGFLLETIFEKPLSAIFQERLFAPWKMTETSFGPRREAVPTLSGITDGLVHDPKAKILGEHCGSAGLFSTLADLQLFCDHYLEETFSKNLWKNYGSTDKPRSIGWNLDGDWIDHTGYTGPFLMINQKAKQAVIFLTNRTYAYDDRPLWIAKRRELKDVIKREMQGMI